MRTHSLSDQTSQDVTILVARKGNLNTKAMNHSKCVHTHVVEPLAALRRTQLLLLRLLRRPPHRLEESELGTPLATLETQHDATPSTRINKLRAKEVLSTHEAQHPRWPKCVRVFGGHTVL